MLLRFLTRHQFNSNLLIVFLILLAWLPFFITKGEQGVAQLSGSAISGELALLLPMNSVVYSALFSLLLVIFNGGLLIHLNTVNFFIQRRTWLPLLFYGLICAAYGGSSMISPAMLSSTLVIIAFFRIFAAYEVRKASVKFLDAGIIITVAGMVYYPALLFIPFIFVAKYIVRPSYPREYAYTLTGILIPPLYLWSYYFIKGEKTHFGAALLNAWQTHVNDYDITPPAVVYVLFVLILVISGSILLTKNFGTMRISAGRFFKLFFWIFVFSIAIFLLIPLAGPGMVYFAAIPVAFNLSYYFHHCKKRRLNSLAFSAFILLSFAMIVLRYYLV